MLPEQKVGAAIRTATNVAPHEVFDAGHASLVPRAVQRSNAVPDCRQDTINCGFEVSPVTRVRVVSRDVDGRWTEVVEHGAAADHAGGHASHARAAKNVEHGVAGCRVLEDEAGNG